MIENGSLGSNSLVNVNMGATASNVYFENIYCEKNVKEFFFVIRGNNVYVNNFTLAKHEYSKTSPYLMFF